MRKVINKFITLLIVCSIVAGSMNGMSFQSKAADVEHSQNTYDIAVVFDNSGSMYAPNNGKENLRWSRAKYAMEIFASMLDYSRGDTLTIFPMWKVVTDGSTPAEGTLDSVEVKDSGSIDYISNLYTPVASSTPFEPITKAVEYLKTSEADEKWLIVLTDGKFDSETRNGGAADIQIEERMKALADGSISVEYLAFGSDAATINGNPDISLYARQVSDDKLEGALIDVCNEIFSRSPLPEGSLNGESLTLDLSMDKLIVFVQGKGATVEGLVSQDGSEIPMIQDSGQRTFSIFSAGGKYANSPYDESLAGQVVTFDSCAAGEYKLSYTTEKSDKIKIFYEPDVDLKVMLMSSDGVEVDPTSGELSKGTYSLQSVIVDRVTGEDVTNHELMGDSVEIKNFVKCTGQSDYKVCENGEEIEFNAGDSFDIYVEASYVIGEDTYRLSNQGNGNNCFSVEKTEIIFEINATVEQTSNWFNTRDYENWEPIRVDMTVNGQPLTEEQMNATTFEVITEEKLEYYCEKLPGESAYNVYVANDEGKNYIEPEMGRYNLEFNATFTDENSDINLANDNASIEIRNYHQIWRWLIWLLLLLLILLLILLYMSRKVLPRHLKKDGAKGQIFTWLGTPINGGNNIHYDRKGRMLRVTSAQVPGHFEANCSATFALYPVDRRWTSSAKRHFGISNITGTASKVTCIKIDGVNYNKGTDGKFVVSGGAPGEAIDVKTYNPIIKVITDTSTLDCKFIQTK